MSEWYPCPKCGLEHENMCACPEPHSDELRVSSYNEPAWCAEWLSEEDGWWYFYDPANERHGSFASRRLAVEALLACKYD